MPRASIRTLAVVSPRCRLRLGLLSKTQRNHRISSHPARPPSLLPLLQLSILPLHVLPKPTLATSIKKASKIFFLSRSQISTRPWFIPVFDSPLRTILIVILGTLYVVAGCSKLIPPFTASMALNILSSVHCLPWELL